MILNFSYSSYWNVPDLIHIYFKHRVKRGRTVSAYNQHGSCSDIKMQTTQRF